jgi:hypothetical protein
VNHALNEWLREQRQWRHAWSAARTAVRAQGEDTPFELESAEEDGENEEEEGEVITPPHSPLREALPSLHDIFHRQARITIDARQPKWTWTETGLSTGSSSQPHLVLVTPSSGG